MKKIIEKIYCDDCGKEIKNYYNILLPIASSKKDFCHSCLSWRVDHSISIIPDRKCTHCNGKGKIREPYYHNEYEEKQCSFCKGTGIRS